MEATTELIVFLIDGRRFALPLAVVRRIVRAVEVAGVPNAPGLVSGVIDLQGEVIAVFDMRRRLGLLGRDIGLADQFIIAQTRERTLALVVDEVRGLVRSESVQAGHPLPDVPGFDAFQGVARLDDGLVLIQDLEKFLSPAEASALDDALQELR